MLCALRSLLQTGQVVRLSVSDLPRALQAFLRHEPIEFWSVVRTEVSFLLPVAWPAPYLRETLNSIAIQSVSEWRLVAVVDGPGRDVETLLRKMIPRKRLTVIHNATRMGISAALNAGLPHVNTRWIARIDADDVNRPDRLERQLIAAEKWTESVVIGGSAGLIDDTGRRLGALDVPSGPDIRRKLLLRNQVVHSATLLKTSAIVAAGGYSPTCHLREDYELWLRLSAVGQIGNVPDEVIDYRLGAHQTSRGSSTSQAYREVQSARRLAASALGYSEWSAWWRGTIWRVGQSGRSQKYLGRLSGVRNFSGTVER